MADYEISEDKLTYTLRLKKGVRFSDGTPMTQRMWRSPIMFFVILPMTVLLMWRRCSFKAGRIMSRAEPYTISGIKVIDASTIQFRLEKPNAQAIWFFSSGVLSKAYYGRDFTKGNVESIKALNDKPMGAGLTCLKPTALEKAYP
jgi:peptide/nickel transport system substrate-binding protein